MNPTSSQLLPISILTNSGLLREGDLAALEQGNLLNCFVLNGMNIVDLENRLTRILQGDGDRAADLAALLKGAAAPLAALLVAQAMVWERASMN